MPVSWLTDGIGSSTAQKNETISHGNRDSSAACTISCYAAAKTALSEQEEIFSISNPYTKESVNVRRSEEYTNNSPVYLVWGTDVNGNPYQQKISANNVNPQSATFPEILVFGAHAGKSGTPGNYLSMAIMQDREGNRNFLDKRNYMRCAEKQMEVQKQIGKWEGCLWYSSFLTATDSYTGKMDVSGKLGWLKKGSGAKVEINDDLAVGVDVKKKEAPYSHLAHLSVLGKVIGYNGVTFFCDDENQLISLGDMSSSKQVLTISLENGGCLKVNRENIGQLAKAITMFSSEDIGRILSAIEQDKHCRGKKEELEELEETVCTNLGNKK